MAKNKWLWIGCGGCLGIIVLIGIALAVIFYMAKGIVGDVGKKVALVQNETDQLKKLYPYPAPAQEAPVEPARYEQFLAIRDRVTSATQAKLGWFLDFTKTGGPPKNASAMGYVKKFIGMFGQILDVILAETAGLRAQQMSPGEYEYLTRLTAAEIHSWLELDATDPRVAKAKAYFDPIQNMDQGMRSMRKQNPRANVQGMIDVDEFMHEIKATDVSKHLNRELITSHADRVTTPAAAAFTDALIVGGGVVEQQDATTGTSTNP